MAARPSILAGAIPGPAAQVARTQQAALQEYGHDRNRIIFSPECSDPFLGRERRLTLGAAVQHAKHTNSLATAGGIGGSLTNETPTIGQAKWSIVANF